MGQWWVALSLLQTFAARIHELEMAHASCLCTRTLPKLHSVPLVAVTSRDKRFTFRELLKTLHRLSTTPLHQHCTATKGCECAAHDNLKVFISLQVCLPL